MVPEPCKDRKTPTAVPRATNDRLTQCSVCKGRGVFSPDWRKDCKTCHGRGFVPVKMTGVAGLTWQEQQEVLVLLRYWYECGRGGLPMDEAVLLFTKALLDKHPART